jgi:hypothetical protein
MVFAYCAIVLLAATFAFPSASLENVEASPRALVDSSNFLENWIGNTLPFIGGATLHELTLPGSHDSMTYDLSETVADGGVDDHPEIAVILHDFSG